MSRVTETARKGAASGRLGLQQASRKGSAVIVFADLVGSSELSEYMSLEQYAAAVRTFHECAEEIKRFVWQRDPTCTPPKREHSPGHEDVLAFSPRGDEVCVIAARLSENYADPDPNMLFSAAYGTWVMRTVLGALKFALSLKAAWLLWEYNVKERILRGRLPLDVAIGIHVGPVIRVANGGRRNAAVSDFIGYAINLAKRIESTGREGQSTEALWTSIMVSPEVRYIARHALPDVLFHVHPQISLKGILRPPRVGEVREVLSSQHFMPQGWSLKMPGGLEPKRVGDALAVLVGSHAELPGFRFQAAMALQSCGMAQNADILLSEKLVQSVVTQAHECFPALPQSCRDTLWNSYALLENHPMAERMLATCCTALGKPTEATRHWTRLGARQTEYFANGKWTEHGGPSLEPSIWRRKEESPQHTRK